MCSSSVTHHFWNTDALFVVWVFSWMHTVHRASVLEGVGIHPPPGVTWGQLIGGWAKICGVQLPHHSSNSNTAVNNLFVSEDILPPGLVCRNQLLLHSTYTDWHIQHWRNCEVNEKKRSRDANTARALAVVRCGHRASPPARPLQTRKHTDRTDNNTLRRS